MPGALSVELSVDDPTTLVNELPHTSFIIRDTMVINPPMDAPDNRVQGLPPVRAKILPEEVPKPFQFGRKAMAGKFQPPVSFTRPSSVTASV